MKLPFLKTVKNEPKISQSVDEAKQIKPKEAVAKLSQGMTSIKDIIAPGAIEVDFDYLKIGNKYFRTLFIAGYPRFVSANWLAPLITFDHSLDIAMFIYPVEGKSILDELRRKIAEMEAEIQTSLEKGKLIEPSTKAKLEDAHSLQEQLIKGAERFFQFGLYVTIPADSLEELNQISKQVSSTLGSLLIVSKHATLQMEEGFKATIPACVDKLMITRNMDTTSLATTFPFTSSELTSDEGIMYGINEHNDSLIIFDRFEMENANSCLFGKSGCGKSLEKNTIVIIKDCDGSVKLETIGNVVEKKMAVNQTRTIDEGIEGVINPGFEVFTFDQNLKGQWAKVTVAARKKFSRRNRLCKIVTASGREITVTTDHNLIVLRKGKIRAMRSEAIKVGERIPLSRILPEPETWPTKLKPPHFLKQWPNNLPQQISLDKNVLYLLGLATSEGLVCEKLLRIFNTCQKVLQIIQKGAEALGASTHVLRKNNKIIGYSITPFHFAKLLTILGFGGKSGEKRVPPLIFSLSNKQIGAYLGAYFEGDGTIRKEGEVSCCSKSKELISDLAYLLLRFGIVGRIRKIFKHATNSQHQGNYYYELDISGGKNLASFAKNIGFLTKEKNEKLEKLLARPTNTNVDTIPTLEPLFQKIYKTLYGSTEIKSPGNLSSLARGVFSPSREEVKKIITQCEKRIKKLNRLLWQDLGQSWRIMKKKEVIPGVVNVLRAYKTVTGETITVPELKQTLYETFSGMGVSLLNHDHALWSAVTQRKNGNTAYKKVYLTSQYLVKRYRSIQLELRHIEKKLTELKLLANSDLFWDPIVKIDKIKHKEKYVYDLMVDNEVFLAGFGGMFIHNSYLVKLEAFRSLMFDAEVIIIDPEAEYKRLAEAINGEYITFGFDSQAKINPFDLSAVREEDENELGLKILSLHSLFKVIMGQLSATEEALLDRALVLTYKMKGITADPATQKKEPPLMEDLYKTLIGMEEPESQSLAARIEKFVKGGFAGIFDQHSNVDITNPFTVFSLKELEESLRPIAMFIILDYIWTKIKKEMKKRILIVDEAWYLMKYPDSANFLYSIAKRARKYYLGLTTITQDVEDFLDSEHGKAIVTNSSMQILMKQSSAAIDKVAQVFYLSEGEKHLLLSADIGEGLFFAGANHVALRVIASPEEHQLITTKPEEILAQQISEQ